MEYGAVFSPGKLVLFELVFLLMALRLSCRETDYLLEIDQDTLMISGSALHFSANRSQYSF